jgi:UDP-N-acetyl-D-glucosamine dehydrogenase
MLSSLVALESRVTGFPSSVGRQTPPRYCHCMSIGIVGLGYVGLPLAVTFAEAGEHVIAVDIDAGKIAGLREGRSHIEDIPSERLAAAHGQIEFTTRAVDLHKAEAILLCVPTPLNRNREPDLGPLLSAAQTLSGVLARGQLVVLESTTFPGTTREHLVPLLEESGLVAGADFALAFSPERVDPGRTDYTIANTPKIVGGLTPQCTQRALDVYGRVCETLVPVSAPEVAELAKLLENIFRSVNIALVNELAILADRMDIDIWEVVDAAATKPFGFMRFEPGPGMGGHCLPVDPFYLTWKAREYDMVTEFIELAGKVNKQMPYFCLEKIERALNDAGKPVKGSRILLVGVAYKGGVGDLRESPALKIIDLLRARGGDVSYHDPHVAELPQFGLRSAELGREVDLAVIVTVHPGVDHGAIVEQSPAVLDLRGVTRDLRDSKVTQL